MSENPNQSAARRPVQHEPFPYPDAVTAFNKAIGEAMVNASNALAVLVFGTPEQKRRVEAWMDRNQERARENR